VDERAERQAKNEALLRAVNREIENASEQLGDRDLEVVCECGRETCGGLIYVTADIYDSVHIERDRFLVLPGHESPEIERVVEATERYVVVDKFGEAEDVVERQDQSGA
jgi:diaminopimelate decarboxylase